MFQEPRTKQQLKSLLMNFLYMPVHNEIKRRETLLIEKNCSLINSTALHFIYRGELYQVDPRVRTPRRLNRLDPRLHGEMEELIAETNDLYKREIPLVMGYITQVLNMSDNYYDYLKAFPESVHRPLIENVKVTGEFGEGVGSAVINELIAKNTELIAMMKQRMILNLLL